MHLQLPLLELSIVRPRNYGCVVCLNVKNHFSASLKNALWTDGQTH